MQKLLNANAQAVLDVVRAAENHPTALEVYEAIRRIRPHIGLATVYRILHQLAEQGLIRELGRDTDSVRYDARTTPHDHAVCTDCGTLLDIPVAIHLSNQALEEAAQAVGVTLGSHEVRIYGKCRACQAKES